MDFPIGSGVKNSFFQETLIFEFKLVRLKVGFLHFEINEQRLLTTMKVGVVLTGQ